MQDAPVLGRVNPLAGEHPLRPRRRPREPVTEGHVAAPLQQPVEEERMHDGRRPGREPGRGCVAGPCGRPAGEPVGGAPGQAEAEHEQRNDRRGVPHRKRGGMAGHAQDALGGEHQARGPDAVPARVAAAAGLLPILRQQGMHAAGHTGLPHPPHLAGAPVLHGLDFGKVAGLAGDRQMGVVRGRLRVAHVTLPAVAGGLA